MIIIIQCAASKQSCAGHLVTANGKRVVFVAQPQDATTDPAHAYARPDDLSDTGSSWRDVLLSYNQQKENNPLGLYPAYQLYQNKAYERLVKRFGVRNVYILSAGWGLIAADFLTPYYDITYSQSAPSYKRRRKTDRYHDFRMSSDNTEEEIIFFGGKDYLPLFCALTDEVRGRKTIFYNSANAPKIPGYTLKRFETTTRTNWHYKCVNAFLDGTINAK